MRGLYVSISRGIAAVAASLTAGILLWVQHAPQELWWVLGLLFPAALSETCLSIARSIKEKQFRWSIITDGLILKPFVYGNILSFVILCGLAVDELAIHTHYVFVFKLPSIVGSSLLCKELFAGLADINFLSGNVLAKGPIKPLLELIEHIRLSITEEQRLVTQARSLASVGVKACDVRIVSHNENVSTTEEVLNGKQ